tara:strand:- start:99 stop:620 length:522 start_codon:yes stop_codon:yes gene_type:complete
MIRKIKFFLLAIFFFSHCSYSLAENNIRFIDIDYIYKNAIASKKIDKKIQTNLKIINDEFSNYKKEIEEEKNNLINQKNILSKEELEKKSINLEKKVNKYNQTISKKKADLTEYSNKAKIKFYTNLTNISQDYAKKNSIEIIIKKKDILIGINTLDITQDLLKLFDENFKTLK